MKDLLLKISFVLLVPVISVSLYYTLVNSVFSNKVLLPVNIEGQLYTLLPENQVRSIIANSAAKELPGFLTVVFENEQFSIPTNSLEPKINISNITNFGKGKDVGKVLGDSIQLLSGKVLDSESLVFEVNPEALARALPLNLDDSNFAYIEGTEVKNCHTGKFYADIDKEKLATLAETALNDKEPLYLTLAEIDRESGNLNIVELCKKYSGFTESLDRLTNGLGNWQDLLSYNLKSLNETGLEIKDSVLLEQKLTELNDRLTLKAEAGAYTEKDGKIYMYKKHTQGRTLDLATTAENLAGWLRSPDHQKEILAFIKTNPEILNSGKEVVDLTNKIAEGTSRLDIMRDGYKNYRVANSQVALDYLNNFILQPKAEFSFIRDSGILYGKNYAAIGICNATTTYFRSALLAGFPITDRSPHTSYIWSYEYPFYPINNVEATFFGGPIVDLKFVNDLEYPVLLHTVIDRSPNDGFQYHKIEVYTSPKAPERRAELTDFKKWNVKSEHKFQSSFTRNVWQDGALTRSDTFSANYYN